MKLITKEKAKKKAARKVPKKVIKELGKLLVEGFVNNQKVVIFSRNESFDDAAWKNLGELITKAGYKAYVTVEGYKIIL